MLERSRHCGYSLLRNATKALLCVWKDLLSDVWGGQMCEERVGWIRGCLHAKMPTVVVELPHLGRVCSKGLRRGQAHRIMRSPQPASASKGGDATCSTEACAKRSVVVSPAAPSALPTQADNPPAPAKATGHLAALTASRNEATWAMFLAPAMRGNGEGRWRTSAPRQNKSMQYEQGRLQQKQRHLLHGGAAKGIVPPST